MKSPTLIVVAAYDDTFKDNLATFKGGDVVVWDTSSGGRETGAYINAYRKHYYHSYLFLQDSLIGNVDDCVAPFRENGKEVVAWGTFPMFFDDQHQAVWVANQYPGTTFPRKGIFGPVFYATRKALQRIERKGWLPKPPPNKLMAQGTERAWAFACDWSGIELGSLGGCTSLPDDSRLRPEDQTFTKIFAGRA